jgi:hypothetical protein
MNFTAVLQLELSPRPAKKSMSKRSQFMAVFTTIVCVTILSDRKDFSEIEIFQILGTLTRLTGQMFPILNEFHNR